MRGIKKTGLPSSIPLPKFGAGTLISQRHECVRIKYDFWPRLGILIDTITIRIIDYNSLKIVAQILQ